MQKFDLCYSVPEPLSSSHISNDSLCSFKYFLNLTVLDSTKSYRKIFGDDATDLPTIS